MVRSLMAAMSEDYDLESEREAYVTAAPAKRAPRKAS